MIDRNGVLDRTKTQGGRISLELGCGDRKRHANAVGIDLLDVPGVDIVGDVETVLRSLPDGCVDRVWSYHFLEHVADVGEIMRELGRVCAANAVLELTVPHFANPYFSSDPTHRQPFGLYTMSYFSEDKLFSRRVPQYGLMPLFDLHTVDLIFKSPPPRYLRYAFKKLVQLVFNSSYWMKELHEEMFCYFLPSYEIRYVLMRNTQSTRCTS